MSTPAAADNLPRCSWTGTDPLYLAYHDEEWGVPCHDDQQLFERLILEGFQAGLSWLTILRKREAFRQAYDEFDPAIVADYGPDDVARLLADVSIVRNRLKINASIRNAQSFLAIQQEFGSFDTYVWSFVNGAPLVRPTPPSFDDVPATTAESDALSNDLKRRGFSFAGSTITYAFMQSIGMVDDHAAGCFRART